MFSTKSLTNCTFKRPSVYICKYYSKADFSWELRWAENKTAHFQHRCPTVQEHRTIKQTLILQKVTKCTFKTLIVDILLFVPLWLDCVWCHFAELSSSQSRLGPEWGSSRCQSISWGTVRSRSNAAGRGRWWRCDHPRCRPHPCGVWTRWWCELKRDRGRDLIDVAWTAVIGTCARLK